MRCFPLEYNDRLSMNENAASQIRSRENYKREIPFAIDREDCIQSIDKYALRKHEINYAY